jgi:hypothetical protein
MKTVMEAVSSSETSVSIYQTTRRNISEDNHLLLFVLIGRPEMKRPLLDDRSTWDDNIKIVLKYVLSEDVKQIHVVQDSDQ